MRNVQTIAGDEVGRFRAEEKRQGLDILRLANPSHRLLDCIWAADVQSLRIDPAG